MEKLKNNCNLLFCYTPHYYYVGAIIDFANAFARHSRSNVSYLHDFSGEFDLTGFDAVIFNYCFWSSYNQISEVFLQKVKKFKGTKIAILQDEYDTSVWYRDALIDMKIDCIVTNIRNQDDWFKVYHSPELAHLEFITALTGYVPDSMLNMPSPKPFDERKWEIGYRGRTLHFKYGRLGWEKYYIGKRMKEICEQRNICANIAVDEDSRIYGDAWPEFIRDCRVTLGSESGSNVFDMDGTLIPAINQYLDENPNAEFETVYELFLKDIDGKIKMNMVSPRVFESIALGTVLVLFEGEYWDIIQPWIHYIPLKKDFSNIDEVLDAVSDTMMLEKISKQAYQDVILSQKYSYANLVNRVDDYIEKKTSAVQSLKPIYMQIGWRDNYGNSKFLSDIPLGMPTPELFLSKDQVVRPVRYNPFFKCALVVDKKVSCAIYNIRKIRCRCRQKAIDILQFNDSLYRLIRWIYRKTKSLFCVSMF
ncbi:MAG: hypothetical protein JXR78_13470 [Victivallales bacterium]|nr:hypothetical protein [Victivallales bacterium]